MIGGFEFVLERLTHGSIINTRNFLVEDIMQVNIRSLTPCKIYTLTNSRMQKIVINDPVLEEKVSKLQYHILYHSKTNHLDFATCEDYRMGSKVNH